MVKKPRRIQAAKAGHWSASGGFNGALSGGWPWAPLFSLNFPRRIQLACGWFLPHLQSPNALERYYLRSLLPPNRLRLEKVDSQEPFLRVPIEQVNYPAGHKSMAMTKRYDHANEERYGAAIEALDAAAEALAAARWKQTE